MYTLDMPAYAARYGISLGLLVVALVLLEWAVASPEPANAAGGTTAITETSTFRQNLYVNGSVSKGSGSFVIDHPLDPKNKLLYHSFVESPDMKNIYDGVITLDARGNAIVELPSYFLALNEEFRYLATALGQPMPGLYVSKEVRRSGPLGGGAIELQISGGKPGGRVSWQVTGIRHDPLAELYPIVTEVQKTEKTLVPEGEYLHPDVY